MTAFDDAFHRAQELVARFDKGKDHYLSPGYQESELRNDFLNEFLTLLGWDVVHRLQTNPLEQEVKIERSVDTGGAQPRADYAFSIAPNFRDPRLVVEAKKPATELAGVDPYFQTIRYGWWKHIPLAGLTNFAEFHLLDCRYVPNPDTVLQRCVKRWHYTDYSDRDKFAELYWLVSREAVAGNMLEKFVKELPRPRGRLKQHRQIASGFQTVDESFLEKLDGHRNALARSFKSRNAELDSEALTEITQRTVDRLVFMRFLEDKLIVPDHFVDRFGADGSTWADFVDKSRELDRTYNGTVFKEHAIVDAPGFAVDEAAFSEVCADLSHKNTLYDFNEIPIHILGSIYERFLGNVIIATPKRVRVEPKPEVRKAGGVYYTPDYIVRYIVENTVGRLIDGMTPDEIAEMQFADIACGSGSFLLGVYETLLGYHIRWYNAHPRRARKGDCVKKDGLLHLSLEKRRDILLNNIYGVDIDAQAVEVTQLSLYLKLLEEETLASARDYQLRIHAAILPPLNKNIVCGNSIVGTDILEGQLFPVEEERKLNPMNFEDRFPQIMSRGGFDAIVGNPPYGAELGQDQADYLREKYRTATRDLDSYALFMERAVNLVKPQAKVSMIVPTGWYSGAKFGSLRRFIATTTDPRAFVNLPYDVFDAWVDTTIFVTTKRKSPTSWPRTGRCLVRLRTFPKRHKIASVAEFDDNTRTANFSAWFADGGDEYLTYADGPATLLLRKVVSRARPLAEVADVQRGVTPFVLTAAKTHPNSRRAFAGTVRRYTFEPGPVRYVRYDNSLAEFKPLRYFEGPRLLLRELISRQFRLQAVRVEDDYVTNKSMQSILGVPEGPDLNYVLGILNSRLMSWFFLRRSNIAQRDDFPKIVLKETRVLPIMPASDKPRHNRLVKLVDQMLEAQRQRAAARTDKDRDYYGHKCAGLDRQIDTLVYELYGLTADEIHLVEGTE